MVQQLIPTECLLQVRLCSKALRSICSFLISPSQRLSKVYVLTFPPFCRLWGAEPFKSWSYPNQQSEDSDLLLLMLFKLPSPYSEHSLCSRAWLRPISLAIITNLEETCNAAGIAGPRTLTPSLHPTSDILLHPHFGQTVLLPVS